VTRSRYSRSRSARGPGESQLRRSGVAHRFSASGLFPVAVACSLLLHLGSGAFVLGKFNLSRLVDRAPPAVYVDLIAPPVREPVRGDATAALQAPAAQPVAPLAAPVKVPAQSKPAAKTPTKTEKKPAANEDAEIRKALDAMRQRREDKEEQQGVQDTIAAMRAKAAKAAKPAAAAAGSPEGAGPEAGSTFAAWIRHEFSDVWNLPGIDPGLYARLEIVYDRQGYLVTANVTKWTNNKLCDDSIKRALERFKQKRLPEKIRREWKETIILRPSDD